MLPQSHLHFHMKELSLAFLRVLSIATNFPLLNPVISLTLFCPIFFTCLLCRHPQDFVALFWVICSTLHSKIFPQIGQINLPHLLFLPFGYILGGSSSRKYMPYSPMIFPGIYFVFLCTVCLTCSLADRLSILSFVYKLFKLKTSFHISNYIIT